MKYSQIAVTKINTDQLKLMDLELFLKVSNQTWKFARSMRIAAFIIALLVLLFALPSALRILVLSQNGLKFEFFDLSSLLVDGFILAFLLMLTNALATKFAKLATVFLCVLFVVIIQANIEFIQVFDKTIEFGQAGFILNPTFFWGSAVHLYYPLTLVFSAVTVVLIWFTFTRFKARTRVLVALFSLVAIFALNAKKGTDSAVITWRSESLLQQNAKSVSQLIFVPNDVYPIPPEAVELVIDAISGKEGGEKVVAPIVGQPNILLLVLESVSGAYLPSIAQWHEVESNVKMTNLDRFIGSGLKYSRFFAHQRSTTRGTYALLCSDMPEFSNGRPKLEQLGLAGNTKDCLPSELRRAGYSTTYLQAAPLSFSNKDKSLPLIGFDNVYGASDFDSSELESAWGVNDEILFDKTIETIEQLESGSKPWFLTVLNVGTHHPFDIVPKSFSGSKDTKVRAFEFLDEALGKLFLNLDANETLANTLVFVTSDESGGLVGNGPPSLQQLARNWSFLGIVNPQLPPKHIPQNFGHIDFAATMFDLIGYNPSVKLAGQSAVRKLESDRPVYLYNNLGGYLTIVNDVSYLLCETNNNTCQRTETPDGKLGSGHDGQLETNLDQMRAAMFVNNPVIKQSETPLAPLQTWIATDPANNNYLLCCNYVDVLKGESIQLSLKGKREGSDGALGYVEIVSSFDNEFITRFNREIDTRDKREFNVDLNFIAAEDLYNVEVRMRFSTETRVVFERAKLTVEHN